MRATDRVLFRAATAADADALVRLARLDSARPLAGDVLLAEVDGEAVAAVATESGRAVADPFRPTAALVRALAELAAARRHEVRAVTATAQRRRLPVRLARALAPQPRAQASDAC